MIHDLSLGEVQSLALKATRGAGRSHGIAEEGAYATRWLIERGHDGAGQLAALLEASDGTTASCPLHLGAAWSDAGYVPEGPTDPVLCPMLLLPFLPSLCAEDHGFSVQAGQAEARVSTAGVLSGGGLPTSPGKVQVTRCAPPASGAKLTRARVDDATLAILTAFAARTYAPATEASRARGAGAGLSDND